MSAAYFKLLRETKDSDFHEALIRSQRRWLQQRATQRFGLAKEKKTEDRDILLRITRDRLDALKKSTLIHTMEAERKAAVKDSGGPFVGYEADCDIFPPPYGNWNYSCHGSQHRQHGNRICSTSTEWASGHTTVKRFMSIFQDGTFHPIASCSFGYAASHAECPGTGDYTPTGSSAHWHMTPTERDVSPPQLEKLWKYDPDIDLGEDNALWMDDCLSANVFPPLGQRGASPAEKDQK